MEFVVQYITAKSRCHERNEDSFICNDKYIVIADGMGGEACGEVASKIAISTISSYMDNSLKEANCEDDIQMLAFSAISYADKEILKYIAAHPEANGMGTTVVLMIHIDQNLYVAWCGDSRCYYLTPSKRLNSLTTDHSYVQQLVNEGIITVDESFTHPDNNLITNYVGGGEDTCKPEFISSKLDIDGCVILCSDGLSGYCKTDEIERELQQSSYDNLPKKLLELAIRKGSDDDITIVTLTPKDYPQKDKNSVLGWLKRLIH